MKKRYQLEDLDCANCAAKMEESIKKLDEIKDANVSFMAQTLTIEVDDDANIEKIMKKVVKCISKVEPDCTVIMD